MPFASERSAGQELDGVGVVQPLTDETIQGFDLAIFSAGGATSGEWAPRFADAGARRRRQLLALADGRRRAARRRRGQPATRSTRHRGIVANPNCSTMQMVVALKPLHDAAGIERLVISTYQAVSGTGQKARRRAARPVARAAARPGAGGPAVYPHQIAFNVLPHAGTFADGDDHTDEERKLMNETRKILGDPSIRISATCVRVPVVNGHSESVNVEMRAPLSPEEARSLLAARARA